LPRHLINQFTGAKRRIKFAAIAVSLGSLAIVLASYGVARAEGVSQPLASVLEPVEQTQIFIGFYVNAIQGVDWQQRRFYADVYWWIRYLEPAKGSQQAKADAVKRIEAIEFLNADQTNFSHKELERKIIASPHGREVYVNYRTVTYFHFETDFHRYPFDAHELPIIIEHETLGADNLVFVDDAESYAHSAVDPSRWGLGNGVSVQDFSIVRASRRVVGYRYDTNFGDPELLNARGDASFETSRMTLAIEIRRIFMPYLVKIMIPLVICLVLPYLVFFIDAGSLDVATGLTVTSLLACVAIQLTVVPGLPDVGYVVTSDLLFYLAYFLAMLAMGQTVWTATLAESHREHAHRLDVLGRFVYPAIFVLGFLWVIWF